jgi:hypothetical protein
MQIASEVGIEFSDYPVILPGCFFSFDAFLAPLRHQ